MADPVRRLIEELRELLKCRGHFTHHNCVTCGKFFNPELVDELEAALGGVETPPKRKKKTIKVRNGSTGRASSLGL